MLPDDAKKCKIMLDLAWALSVIAAMSGAVEWPDHLPDQYDHYNYDAFGDHDDEIDVKTTVERWLDGQAQYTEER
ncbi:hypothetical protein SNK03_010299 [Fusarium graminearum]|uniref:Chromosome 4, complete genome n=2 Tax=Gibberella zeae TaxID=5518 RepID=A0A0E0SCP1_GIBZE|nr:hypothetical protein FG05_35301 [Fusarium graminearum]CAF3645114.1 unnamed protein product [Fusarium graminearum]CEF84204.1 unnamed protein product [Fusarium graminearum]CZS74832.1 unnamed protein product [Fusarium graminearum]